MDLYASFLGAMSFLFVASAAVLLPIGLYQIFKRRGRKAVIYLALTVLAVVVAAGFHFFKRLIAS